MAVTLKSPYVYTQDLTKPIGVVYRPEIVFTKDNLADKISVALYNGTEAASVVGAVTGTVIRADRSTVPIENGTITGNVVTVALTREQIEIPGQLQVFIKLTSGGVEATIFAGVFTAIRTETDTVIDPGTVISSVSQLITDIRNAIGSIPADLTQLMTAIAPIYSSEQTYAAGAYRWYDGNLYRSRQAITTPEEWTASHWVQVALANDVQNLRLYVAGARFEGTKTTEDGRTSMVSLSANFPGNNEIPVFAIFGTRLAMARIMYGSDDHIEYYPTYDAPDAMMWSPAARRTVETVDFIFSTSEPGRTVRVVAATGIEAVKLKAEVEAITARQPCIRYDIDQDLRLKPNQQAIARANLGLTFSETSDGVIVIS